ncbi:MAG: hypothetical protein EOR04_14465 [Mesorhizobium sp.]|uniref:hypothetical protein n=1 Tax=Mesorhizobium sp. TaxID=1871066 RepID=UPI000FE54F19|nr:hypothetical protein [Mesorhizobium sp.]RWP41586.1 MAG: hypothetical protein EOR04_14465 [Mesorhizobium sp.]
MFNYDLSAAVTLMAALLGSLQWYLSWRASSRERDSDLTRWGGEVIDLMAELETFCDPIVKVGTVDLPAVERLSFRASALVDKGRLFFPNVKGGRQSKDDEGTRINLLDEVLRACYVARHLAKHGDTNNRQLREQVWEMRGRFIGLLQKEMSISLRKVHKDQGGQHVPTNPGQWPNPQRKLLLPGDQPPK